MSVCCPTDRTAAAATGDYVPEGRAERISSIDCYVVGNGPETIIMVTDIFGLHQNNYELADTLSHKEGYKVIIPDLFRGAAWPATQFPPQTNEQSAAFSAFLAGIANAGKRQTDIIELIEALGNRDHIALLGFCWGAKVATLAGNASSVGAIVGAHPAFLGGSDGLSACVPTLIIPTGDDDLTDYKNAVAVGKGANYVTINEDFLDMFHGFLAARGDWTDQKQRTRASAAIKVIVNFLARYLKGNNNV